MPPEETVPRRPRIIVCSNTAWSLFNFRGPLIRALVARGYDVVAVAPADAFAGRLAELGCRYVPMPMDNKGTSPARDLQLLVRLWRLLRRESPLAYLGFTVKPNIYGSVAARALRLPHIASVTGLGAPFISQSWVTRAVKLLYRLALREARVVFENQADAIVFTEAGLVRAGQWCVMPTTGVDLDYFAPRAPRAPDGELRFLLIARMLWDKGVGEFVAAARTLRQQHPEARFQLLGFLDVINPAAIAREQMEAWVAEGVVDYLGVTEDVRPQIAAADWVVLPSYREGLSRSLIEAAAMGKPLIATDVPGCREVVEPEVNGFLCASRNEPSLAASLAKALQQSAKDREQLGRASREKARREFDQERVIDRYLEEIATAALSARR